MLIQPARCGSAHAACLFKTGVIGLLAAVALYHPVASARDTFPDYSLNGFGTLGAVYSSLDDADFTGNQLQADGAGRTRSLAASVDSKLGLQLNAHFNPQWSAILQVVAQYDHEGKYRPDVEWAYIDYQLTPDLTIRLGRVVNSTFLESETRLVGYTYPWVRPPQEVYGLNPITNKDGIGIQYRFTTGAVFNSLQFSYGRSRADAPDDIQADADQAADLQYTAEVGTTTFRLNYSSADVEINQPGLTSLFDGLAQFGAAVPGPAGVQALFNANRFRPTGSRYAIFSAGISYKPKQWLLQGEWARADIHSPTILADSEGWYLTAGYHLAQVTPYLTIARLQSDRPASSDIPTDGLPPGLAQPAAALNAALEGLLDSTAASQKRMAAGLRWNFNPNAALKLQIEHVRTDAPGSGRLTNPGPGFTPGDNTNLISFTVDFVF